MTFNQITVGLAGVGAKIAPASQVVWAGQSSVLVYNTSSSVTVYLTEENSYTSGDAGTQAVTALGPMQSIVFNGGSDVYAVAATGQSAVLNLYPGATNFTAFTSVTSILPAFTFPITIPTGGTFQTPILPVASFQSYNCIIRTHTPNVTTVNAPFTANVQFNWYADAAGTIPLFIDSFDIWSGGLSSGQDSYGRGPIGGPFLQIGLTGSNAASAILVDQFLFYGSPATITTTEWRQPSIGSGINQTGFLLRFAGDSVFENITCSFSLVLPATTSFVIPLPLMTGNQWIRLVTTSPLSMSPTIGHAKGLINGAITAGGNPPGTFWSCPAGGTDLTTEPMTIFPRAPTYMVLLTTATSPTVTCVINGNGRSL